MQYILDQQEYDNLVRKEELDNRNIALEILRRKIVPDAQCCETQIKRDNIRKFFYCSECPLGGSYNGENKGESFAIRKLLCDKNQRYPK